MFHRHLPDLPLKHYDPNNGVKKDSSKASDHKFMDFQTFTASLLNLNESSEETDNTFKS